MFFREKLADLCLQPSICFLCHLNVKGFSHVLFACPFRSKCWFKLLNLFRLLLIRLLWVFDSSVKNYVPQQLEGPFFPLLFGLWSERNSQIFEEKFSSNPCLSLFQCLTFVFSFYILCQLLFSRY